MSGRLIYGAERAQRGGAEASAARRSPRDPRQSLGLRAA
jgi:hypothetical protein